MEVKAIKNGNSVIDEETKQKYKNIPFPAVMVFFDNKTDNGYYLWIKKPAENGMLLTVDSLKKEAEELNNTSMEKMVTEIKNWYTNSLAFSTARTLAALPPPLKILRTLLTRKLNMNYTKGGQEP